MPWRIQPLTRSHDRQNFDCGDQDLNAYLRYTARASAAKLARLAVTNHLQRKGLGSHLLLDAMDRVLRVAEHLGIIGFFIDAKDEKAADYYRQFGFIPLPDNALELFLPLTTIRKAFENK